MLLKQHEVFYICHREVNLRPALEVDGEVAVGFEQMSMKERLRVSMVSSGEVLCSPNYSTGITREWFFSDPSYD